MMKQHGESNVDVANNGCWALMNLAVNDANKTIIEKQGGIPVIIQMMKQHGESNVDVAKYGCTTLYYLSFKNTSNQTLIRTSIALINKLKQKWSPQDIYADKVLGNLHESIPRIICAIISILSVVSLSLFYGVFGTLSLYLCVYLCMCNFTQQCCIILLIALVFYCLLHVEDYYLPFKN